MMGHRRRIHNATYRKVITDVTIYGTSVNVQPESGDVGPDGKPSWAAALARVTDMLGPLPMIRTYSGAGINDSHWGSDEIARDVGAATAYSFKRLRTSADRADVRAWLQDPANHGGLLTIWHEPEDNIEKGAFTFADFQGWTIDLCDLIRDAGVVGKVRPAVNLMAWTLNPRSGRDLTNYVTQAVVEALRETQGLLTWDAYNRDATNEDRDPVDMYGVCARASTDRGLPWGVLETGARVSSTSPDVDAVYADWWRRGLTFAAHPWAHEGYEDVPPAEVMLLWNSATGKYDSRIDTMPKCIEVWREFIANNGPADTSQSESFTKADVDAAYAKGQAAGYDEGHVAGRNDGYANGHSDGYNVGLTDGIRQGVNAEYDRAVEHWEGFPRPTV